jgi:hypothetical protein
VSGWQASQFQASHPTWSSVFQVPSFPCIMEKYAAHAREVPRFVCSPMKFCLKKYRSFSPPNGPKPYTIWKINFLLLELYNHTKHQVAALDIWETSWPAYIDVLPYISPPLLLHLSHLAADTTLYGSFSWTSGWFTIAWESNPFLCLILYTAYCSRISGLLSTAYCSRIFDYFVHCFITAVESLVSSFYHWT